MEDSGKDTSKKVEIPKFDRETLKKEIIKELRQKGMLPNRAEMENPSPEQEKPKKQTMRKVVRWATVIIVGFVLFFLKERLNLYLGFMASGGAVLVTALRISNFFNILIIFDIFSLI